MVNRCCCFGKHVVEVVEQISGTEARVEIRHESEWGQSTPPPVWVVPARPAAEVEPQPDASWLRLVDRDAWLRGVETWHYEGPTTAQFIACDDGQIPLIVWLRARDYLAAPLQPFVRDGQSWVRIITRIPLEGTQVQPWPPVT